MANEALKLELHGMDGNGERYTVADGTGIEKGTLMALTGDHTITANAGNGGQVFVGVASTEKVASDGQTTIGVWTSGKFDMLMATGSTCKAGDLLVLSGANAVASAEDFPAQPNILFLSGMIVGRANEAGSSAETIAVRINV